MSQSVDVDVDVDVDVNLAGSECATNEAISCQSCCVVASLQVATKGHFKCWTIRCLFIVLVLV